MQKNAEIKDILLKEASERIYITKELDIKNALLNDAIRHIASVENGLTSVASLEKGLTTVASLSKDAMAAQMGSSYYRLASNVEVTEFPEEEHSKIRQIKKEIMDNFAPLLIQRIKSQGKWVKVDLSELLQGETPFYIRLQFKKHILPMENKDQIVNELEGLAPEFSQLVEMLEEIDLAPVPYYNIQCEKSYKDPAVQLTQKMISQIATLASPSSGQSNFVAQQPNLKGYWDRMSQEMSDPDPKKFPPLYRTIGASTYSTALRWPAEKIDQIPDMNTLLQGVYFAEINEHNTLYSASPQDQKEKKAQWDAFVFAQILPSGEKSSPQDEDKAKILARQKAQVVAERVWKVFGEVPPEKRDIKASVGRGKLEAPYNQFHQNDIRMLLKFLKVPQIRFTSTPRARPNGLDMGHIYPPVNFNAENNSYGLDYIRGNSGLKQLKLNLPKFLSLAQGGNAEKISSIYAKLMSQKDHPIVNSHTGADNFLFMLQNLSSMQMESFNPEYDNKIKSQYGSNANAILNFVRGMLGSLKATKKDADVLNQGPQLYTALAKPTSNGVAFGYEIAKIMDVLQYTILKNLPDPVYKVRGRNYATGGVEGEIMLAVEYAYGVVPNTDIAGGKQENIRALENAPRPMSGATPEMVRKTHYPQQFQPGEQFPQMEKKPVYVEQGDAKLAPYVGYIVTHKTGAIHSRSQRGKNFPTLEAALAHLQGLYPQAEGAMEVLQQKLYLIGLRMDLATKEIRSIVEEAIKLKQAEINAAVGTTLMSETGQSVDESLSELKEEVNSIKEEVQEYDPNYVVDDTGAETQYSLNSTNGMIKEIGQGVPQAEKIVVQLLSTDNWEVVEYLNEKGIKGNALVFYYDHLAQNNLQTFVEFVKKQMAKFQTEKDLFGKPATTPSAAEALQQQPDPSVAPNMPVTPQEPEKNAEENRISKLIKLADKFDHSGYTHIANKIDLLLAKIGTK